MKTYKQSVNESKVADELYEIKLNLGEWYKRNSKLTEKMKNRKEFEEQLTTAIRSLDNAVSMIYGSEVKGLGLE